MFLTNYLRLNKYTYLFLKLDDNSSFLSKLVVCQKVLRKNLLTYHFPIFKTTNHIRYLKIQLV